MIAGITTPFSDMLRDIFGSVESMLILFGIWAIIGIITKEYRKTKLYKLIMGDNAKPYVPRGDKRNARIAEAKEREASRAASAAARREAEMAARRAIMAEVDRAPQPQEEDGGKEAVPEKKADGSGSIPTPADGAGEE